jgi:hypothetical protein
MKTTACLIFVLALSLGVMARPKGVQAPAGEPTSSYQPKSAHDKAHSDAEFAALAYMHTVVSSDKTYYRHRGRYAPSLQALVGTGSFTRRMANPQRGDYTVTYRARSEGFALILAPKQFDDGHRSFYVDESGEFRADPSAAATEASPRLE